VHQLCGPFQQRLPRTCGQQAVAEVEATQRGQAVSQQVQRPGEGLSGAQPTQGQRLQLPDARRLRQDLQTRGGVQVADALFEAQQVQRAQARTEGEDVTQLGGAKLWAAAGQMK
jgi:hypothetical protein